MNTHLPLKTIMIHLLVTFVALVFMTGCTQKPTTEENAAQTKAIVDQAVAETKKQMLADQSAEKAKQEAQIADEAAAKSKQDAAVAEAVAEAKKEFAAKEHKAAEKSKQHKLPNAPENPNIQAAVKPPTLQAAIAPKKMICTTCGVVLSVNEVEVSGKGSGLGVIAGGVVGGLLGNQVGNGSGRDLATIAGAIGGAMAGNKIEKNSKKTKSYDILVKMETGEEVVYHQPTPPTVVKGDAVKIEDDAVVKLNK